MRKYAIIAAGGSGVRMGSAMPKQFLYLNGHSILWHSINAFKNSFDDITVIVVVPSSYLDETKTDCLPFENIIYVEGGASRFQSVKNGLAKVDESNSVIFVHDAVRCLATKKLIQNCYHQAVEKGSAIPSIAVSDSIRMLNDGQHSIIDRNLIRIIQTPQTFKADILLNSFKILDNERFTDEASVVEASGIKVHLIEGEHTNIKITRPIDLLVAETILSERSSFQ
jgi:2-C-methyl-D-erythritol 4-phosphate cytidylyltransferase